MRVIIPVDGSASSSEAIRFIGERARYMSEKPVPELIYVEPPIPDDVIDRIDIDASAAGGAPHGQVAVMRLEDHRVWYAPVEEGE